MTIYTTGLREEMEALVDRTNVDGECDIEELIALIRYQVVMPDVGPAINIAFTILREKGLDILMEPDVVFVRRR